MLGLVKEKLRKWKAHCHITPSGKAFSIPLVIGELKSIPVE